MRTSINTKSCEIHGGMVLAGCWASERNSSRETVIFIGEKTRWHNRFLPGYGTTCGTKGWICRYLVCGGGTGMEALRVSPGAGVNPRGQKI